MNPNDPDPLTPPPPRCGRKFVIRQCDKHYTLVFNQQALTVYWVILRMQCINSGLVENFSAWGGEYRKCRLAYVGYFSATCPSKAKIYNFAKACVFVDWRLATTWKVFCSDRLLLSFLHFPVDRKGMSLKFVPGMCVNFISTTSNAEDD